MVESLPMKEPRIGISELAAVTPFLFLAWLLKPTWEYVYPLDEASLLLTVMIGFISILGGIILSLKLRTLTLGTIKYAFMYNAAIATFIVSFLSYFVGFFSEMHHLSGGALPSITEWVLFVFSPMLKSYLWQVIILASYFALLFLCYYSISSLRLRVQVQYALLLIENFLIVSTIGGMINPAFMLAC